MALSARLAVAGVSPIRHPRGAPNGWVRFDGIHHPAAAPAGRTRITAPAPHSLGRHRPARPGPRNKRHSLPAPVPAHDDWAGTRKYRPAAASQEVLSRQGRAPHGPIRHIVLDKRGPGAPVGCTHRRQAGWRVSVGIRSIVGIAAALPWIILLARGRLARRIKESPAETRSEDGSRTRPWRSRIGWGLALVFAGCPAIRLRSSRGFRQFSLTTA
jgi:hypothetical protein